MNPFISLWIDDGSGPVRNPVLSDDDYYAGLAAICDDAANHLWQAATNYQENYISGAAIGLVTMGVMQGKPKCTAVMTWIDSIWNETYYLRKTTITYEYDSALYDFTVCGPIPYSVPELSAEVMPLPPVNS